MILNYLGVLVGILVPWKYFSIENCESYMTVPALVKLLIRVYVTQSSHPVRHVTPGGALKYSTQPLLAFLMVDPALFICLWQKQNEVLKRRTLKRVLVY